MARSTVGLVLRRLGLGRLSQLEPKPQVVRYEKAAPGELIHIDIKSLGRIAGIGHRITGQHAGHHRARGIGYEHLHVAVDDASRLAYTEVLPSLGKEDATGFLQRALAWYARLGVRTQRVMTDNGSAYRSKLFAKALRDAGARHVRTRPYTPGPTARPNASSRPACGNGLTTSPTPYPTSATPPEAPGSTAIIKRPHAGIGGLTPWQRVNNLLGNDS